MNATQAAGQYLTSIAKTVHSLRYMVICENDPDKIFRIVVEMQELEASTADFIDSVGLDAAEPAATESSKLRFLKANEEVITHLEKFQLQGKNFGELTTALKLECETLRKELKNFS